MKMITYVRWRATAPRPKHNMLHACRLSETHWEAVIHGEGDEWRIRTIIDEGFDDAVVELVELRTKAMHVALKFGRWNKVSS